jgi:poly(hydroxyalkanoate) depolymerase family esterase
MSDRQLTEVREARADPGNVRMLAYVPANLPAKAPLVVVLHGCAQSAAAYAQGAGWLELADRVGFAVLAPEQRAENNPNRCFNWFQADDVARESGEVGSISAMIAAMISAHKLDKTRVFVTGLSAGGAMAGALMAAHPEQFAAGAIIAGLPYRSADNVQQAFGAMMQGRKRAPDEWGDKIRTASAHDGPWPRVSVWHGAADRTVNPINGPEIAAQWANVHGATAVPDHTHSKAGRAYSAWGDKAEPLIELHLIEGLGHGTPLAATGEDGVGTAGAFLIEAGVSSSVEILRFWNVTPQAKAPAPAKAAPKQNAQPQARAIIAPVPAAAKSPEPAILKAKQAKRPPIDIEAVIKKALTAAGLMRN